MKQLFYKSLVVILSVALSCGEMFAAASAGMLRSNGGVSVNGAPVNPITTVFAGDRIETAPQAVGSLTLGSSSLILDPNSSMIFSGQSLDFYCGGGTVQAKQGMSTRYGQISVKPAKDSAKYQVQQTGATLKISALEGDLTLSSGNKDFNIPSGNSMNVPYSGCGQLAKNELKSPLQDTTTNNTPANPPAPQPSPYPIGTSNSRLTSALVIAPAVVLSVALAGIIAVSQNPVSSQAP